MHEKTLGASLPSVMALAYLGDAEYSLFVRRMLIGRGIEKPGELNRASLDFVTADKQATLMRAIEPTLADDEREVYKRAANSTHLNPPKHAKVSDYRLATGFEALIGMLSWIGDRERMEEIFTVAVELAGQPKNDQK